MTYELTIKHFFDASHKLSDSPHLVSKACARLHGHTYAVIVHIRGDNSQNGMVVDFKAVKNVIDVLDHRHINEVFEEEGFNAESTAENVARFIYNGVKKHCGISPLSVEICEGYKGQERSCWVTYKAE